MGTDQRLASLWDFLYDRMSRVSRPSFWHREIQQFPPEEQASVDGLKVLKRLPDAETVTDAKDRRYRVVRTGAQILGVLDDEEAEVIDLNPEDLIAYRIDSGRLFAGIREANQLSGRPETSESGLCFLGSRETTSGEATQVFFSYGLNSVDHEVATLLAVASDNEPVVAVFPVDLGLKRDRRLENAGVNVCHLCENLRIAWPATLHRPKRADGIAPDEVFRKMEAGFGQVGVKMDELTAENEVLRKELAAKLTAIVGEVDPEYFTWILHVVAAGSVSKASKMLKIPNSTFDGRLKAMSRTSPVHQALFRMIEARRRHAGTATFERFNEAFEKHQTEASSPDADAGILMDIFEGLSAQRGSNWESVRDELLEILREHVP